MRSRATGSLLALGAALAAGCGAGRHDAAPPASAAPPSAPAAARPAAPVDVPAIGPTADAASGIALDDDAYEQLESRAVAALQRATGTPGSSVTLTDAGVVSMLEDAFSIARGDARYEAWWATLAVGDVDGLDDAFTEVARTAHVASDGPDPDTAAVAVEQVDAPAGVDAAYRTEREAGAVGLVRCARNGDVAACVGLLVPDGADEAAGATALAPLAASLRERLARPRPLAEPTAEERASLPLPDDIAGVRVTYGGRRTAVAGDPPTVDSGYVHVALDALGAVRATNVDVALVGARAAAWTNVDTLAFGDAEAATRGLAAWIADLPPTTAIDGLGDAAVLADAEGSVAIGFRRGATVVRLVSLDATDGATELLVLAARAVDARLAGTPAPAATEPGFAA